MIREHTVFSVEAIRARALERAQGDLWIQERGALSWGDFGRSIESAHQECVRNGVTPGSVIITPGDASIEGLAWLLGAAQAGAVAAPLRRERIHEGDTWKGFIKISWQVVCGKLERVCEGVSSETADRLLGELRERGRPGLILATGGTTGVAKLVLHDLTALLATIPIKTGHAWRMLPLMRFDHIGGLDAAWRALAGSQVIVEPPGEITPHSVARIVACHKVEVLPATPSFLNVLLLSGADRDNDLGSLRLVPYGAEPMPPGLLERLKTALPKVTFVQRFGTSETGALPVQEVGDGLVLRDDTPGYSWKIKDSELWVKSPARALGYLSGGALGLDGPGWFRTGDLAEQTAEGAMRIIGRREGLMNVGGEKVLPDEVEAWLLSHPYVSNCRVRPEPNALIGQAVVADIVWSGPENDAVTVKRVLHEYAAGRIAFHKLPTKVRLVGSVDSTSNLKKLRNICA